MTPFPTPRDALLSPVAFRGGESSTSAGLAQRGRAAARRIRGTHFGTHPWSWVRIPLPADVGTFRGIAGADLPRRSPRRHAVSRNLFRGGLGGPTKEKHMKTYLILWGFALVTFAVTYQIVFTLGRSWS